MSFRISHACVLESVMLTLDLVGEHGEHAGSKESLGGRFGYDCYAGVCMLGYSRRGREVESELREAAVAMSRLKAPLDSPLLGRALPGTTMRRFGIVSRARGVHLWLEVDLIGSCDRDARRGSSSDHAEIPSTVGLLSSHAYAIDRVVGELQAHGAAVPLSGSADRCHAAKFRRVATRIAGLHVHALRAAAAAANLAARGGPVGMLQRGEPPEMLNS